VINGSGMLKNKTNKTLQSQENPRGNPIKRKVCQIGIMTTMAVDCTLV